MATEITRQSNDILMKCMVEITGLDTETIKRLGRELN